MPASAGKFTEAPVTGPPAQGCLGIGTPMILPPAEVPPFSSTSSAKVSVKRVVLIYNPVSGAALGKKVAETLVVPQLEAAGIVVDVKPTQHAGHGAELAKALPLKGVDALVAIGGDGTLSEIVNGYMQRPSGSGSCALGFIPGGTGNSVCLDLGLGKPTAELVTEAVGRIIAGRTKKFDLQKVQGSTAEGKPAPTQWSFNIVAWGLGTDANVAAEGMRFLGPARYDIAILGEILKFKQRPATITVDGGEPLELPSLMLACVQNNKYTGAGLKCAPVAQLDDGLMDLWFGSPTSRGEALAIDAEIKSGGRHIYSPIVAYYR